MHISQMLQLPARLHKNSHIISAYPVEGRIFQPAFSACSIICSQPGPCCMLKTQTISWTLACRTAVTDTALKDHVCKLLCLKQLSIMGCHQVSDSGIRHLTAAATELTMLDISSCRYDPDTNARTMLACFDCSVLYCTMAAVVFTSASSSI